METSHVPNAEPGCGRRRIRMVRAAPSESPSWAGSPARRYKGRVWVTGTMSSVGPLICPAVCRPGLCSCAHRYRPRKDLLVPARTIRTDTSERTCSTATDCSGSSTGRFASNPCCPCTPRWHSPLRGPRDASRPLARCPCKRRCDWRRQGLPRGPGVVWRSSRPAGVRPPRFLQTSWPSSATWRTTAYAGYALDIVGEARLAVDTTLSSRVL